MKARSREGARGEVSGIHFFGGCIDALAGGLDDEGSGVLAAAGAGNWGLGWDSGPFWPQPTRIIAINGASR